uniref:Acyltransferase n=1 Tax=Parasacculina yatsui TaxID=2836420 RepID=A0A8K1VCG6_9CRUS|nr:PAGAT-like protein [Parasacculina yatsui]
MSLRVFGLVFAPLRLPLRRRLQTAAVAFWIGSFLLMGLLFSLFLLYLLAFTRWWFISLAYTLWMWTDLDICNRGGRRCQWVRKWAVWRYFRDYFPVNLVKTCDLDPKQNYIVGSHPHGMLCIGAFCNFATEGNDFSSHYPGMVSHLLTLEGNYHVPLYREFFLTSGGLACTRRSMEYVLRGPERGHMLVVVAGGASEALIAQPGTNRIILASRKGFVKVALTTGTSLVPSFSFGETETYAQVSNPEGSVLLRLQRWFRNRFGLAPVLLMGRGIFQYSFGVLPHRKPVTVVVGAPIYVDKTDSPSQQDIDDLHARYMEALQKLYDSHKHNYLPDPSVQLEIV